MLARMPYVYAAILVLQTIVLAGVYATDPPAPSDPLSVWLGWIAIGSMVSLLIYSFARRLKRFRDMAKLSYWLHFHIFLGFEGMLSALFHSSHLFTREAAIVWTNPGVLNFLAVCIVFCSGVFGRWMYGRLPHRTEGGNPEGGGLARVYRYWIFAHRPMAAALYLLTFVHIALAFMFSPTLRHF